MQRRSLPSRLLGAALVIFAMTATATDSVAFDRELTEAPDFRVRVQAALRLAKIGGAASRVELERGLRDAHPAVRVACAVGLGTVGDASSIPAIEAAVRSESMGSAKTAMQDIIDKLRNASKGGGSVENAKYVVQLGAMRNTSGVRTGDLDGVMQQAARAKAKSIKDAVVVDGSDATSLKRASDRRIPVLLLDASLTKLTQSTGKDGGVIVTARVDLSIRKVPQQTLKGTVSGNASASDDAPRASQKAITELQNRAVHGAVESAVSSVGSEIAALAN